jgi:hypothetical protein
MHFSNLFVPYLRDPEVQFLIYSIWNAPFLLRLIFSACFDLASNIAI